MTGQRRALWVAIGITGGTQTQYLHVQALLTLLPPQGPVSRRGPTGKSPGHTRNLELWHAGPGRAQHMWGGEEGRKNRCVSKQRCEAHSPHS